MRAVGGQPANWIPPTGTRSTATSASKRPSTSPKTSRRQTCWSSVMATPAPNTVLSGDGGWSGHVDLGSLGVADRWADLAVATWSTEWNYGPGWQELLVDTYGVDADPERRRTTGSSGISVPERETKRFAATERSFSVLMPRRTAQRCRRSVRTEGWATGTPGAASVDRSVRPPSQR